MLIYNKNFSELKMKTKIILIVGASGVGKDTLISHAKEELEDSFNFVKRYVTRKPDINEDNYFVDNYAFEILKNNGFFISHWEAHNNYYGISKNSIQSSINIISISRAKVEDFEKIFENVYTIEISVSKEELRKRLILRKRESLEEIEERINRNYPSIKTNNLIDFDNSYDITISKENFINLLKQIKDNKF